MTQIYTILFDLDGTIINTAPDLMAAHNHVMKKFGFAEKKLSDIKSLAGKGAWVMMQKSFKEEIKDEKIKKEMTKVFLDYYAKNIDQNSQPLKGSIDFFNWSYVHSLSSINSKSFSNNKIGPLGIFLSNSVKPPRIPIFSLIKIGLYLNFLAILIPSFLYSGKQINLLSVKLERPFFSYVISEFVRLS